MKSPSGQSMFVHVLALLNHRRRRTDTGGFYKIKKKKRKKGKRKVKKVSCKTIFKNNAKWNV